LPSPAPHQAPSTGPAARPPAARHPHPPAAPAATPSPPPAPPPPGRPPPPPPPPPPPRHDLTVPALAEPPLPEVITALRRAARSASAPGDEAASPDGTPGDDPYLDLY